MSVQAIVLAAGNGSRMYPFGAVRPKCLLPVCAQPLLKWMELHLQQAGVARMVIVANQRFAPMLRAVSGHAIAIDTAPQGTLTSAAVGASALAQDGMPILVLEGDVWVYPDDLSRLLACSAERDTAAVVLVDRLDTEVAQDWLMVEMDGERVVRCLGHPRDGQWRLSGAYLLGHKARERLGQAGRFGVRTPVGGMPHAEYDLAEMLNDLIDEGETVLAVQAAKPVWNLDKRWHLYEINQGVMDAWAKSAQTKVPSSSQIDSTAVVEGVVEMAEDAVIGRNVVVKGALHMGRGSRVECGAILNGPVWLGEGVRVDEYAKVSHAVLGDQSYVSHAAEVLGGVFMNQVYLVHYGEVYGIIGDCVDFGAGTVCGTLRFDDGHTRHRIGRRWESPVNGSNAVYIGDYARTGVNVTILPGKTIGPYSVIGPGVVVDQDIASHQLVRLAQTLEFDEWGPERYGW